MECVYSGRSNATSTAASSNVVHMSMSVVEKDST